METATATETTPEDLLAARKSRDERYRIGQFFTPEIVAEYMANRVMEVDPDTVLDPAVGGGVLLRALPYEVQRFGLDIDEDAVAISRESLLREGETVEVERGDFLAEPTLGCSGDLPFDAQTFDAIVANPPYVKHHLLDASLKAAMKRRFEYELGVRPSSLSSLYVYFFLEAIRRLNPGGRLVFITPTEFLDASYGRAVKQALVDHCKIDDILLYGDDSLTFGNDILSTSAITVATRRRHGSTAPHPLRISEVKGPTLETGRTSVLDVPQAEDPWTALAPSKLERNRVLHEGRPAVLDDFARVRRGIATGSNSFFCLTRPEVDRWGIEREFLEPCMVGSRDLPKDGSPVTREHFEVLERSGSRCWLLWCHAPEEDLTGSNVLRYIKQGELDGVSEAYNCRSRSPWYSVERVEAPDWFVTYMNRANARFSRNLIGARCLTSLLNVWACDGVDMAWLDQELSSPLIPDLLRSVGRNYGGGLGKTEPSELRKLPLPLPPR